ncbi:MAG: C_GCAxxG_C_C family protein [Bacteroidales bacterium]|nr:C_GCAxxG_C_C family protein [Bacteroidales bacterium]
MTKEERQNKARALHADHHNCCQSVLLAYVDKIGIDADTANCLAAPFGRGLSGQGELCGCVSAMAMVAGLTGNAAEVRPLCDRFRAENGDIVCGRLLRMGKKPCREMVADAAGILSDLLDK